MLLSCSVPLSSYSAFSLYCNSTSIENWSLTGGLVQRLRSVGIFGNANVDNKLDWVNVINNITTPREGKVDDVR